jgi:hypothetical protein
MLDELQKAFKDAAAAVTTAKAAASSVSKAAAIIEEKKAMWARLTPEQQDILMRQAMKGGIDLLVAKLAESDVSQEIPRSKRASGDVIDAEFVEESRDR